MTNSNIFNEISSIYLEEVFKPQLGKGSSAPAPADKKGGDSPAGGGEDGEMKRVRQAVYDIRYRARREDVPLEQAFNQYMSNTSMNAVEKKAVKEKLGIGPGGSGGGSAPVKEESEFSEEAETKKYQVRVTDKLTRKSYVRMATREKINQLRANKNIASVEMTNYGSPYEGEKKKGKATADVTSGKGLAKKDYDGDGKRESGAKEYRGAVHNAIQRRMGGNPDGKDTSNVKEGFSNWRNDLREVVDDDLASEKKSQVKEKRVDNYKGKGKCVNLSPSIGESIQEIGGQLIESTELSEEFLAETVNVAAEYFFNEGLNDEGVQILIEDLGLDSFVEFIFELNESIITEKVETRLQKKAGAPLKGPKGSKVQSSTNAALKKHGLTRKIDSEGPSSTIKKNRKVEAKPEVKASVEKAKETQPKKRPVLDAIAREVNKGVKRHQAAMTAARETGKTIGKAAKGASTVARGFASGLSGTARLAGRLVRGEEFEHVLEELTNAELYFLSDDLIEEVVTEVFYECIEEGYDVDEIEEVLTESLDISLETLLVEEDRYASAVATSKNNAKLVAKNKTAQRRAERTQKVKDTVKSVGERIRSAGKAAVYGAGYAAGKVVSGAKKAASAVKSAGEKAKETAGKVASTARAGYAAGKGDNDSDSDDSKKSSGSYRIKYKTASTKKDSKKPGMLSKIGSALKSGLKKAIASGARSVSRGARNVARRMEESVELQEKITAKTDMGAAIKDFYASKSPQLAGRTKEERRKAAIAAVLTARRGGKELGEAVTQMPGRETTPPEGTTAKQDDIQRKQMLANKQKMMQKQMMLQRQQLQLQKQGKLPMGHAEEVEFEIEEGVRPTPVDKPLDKAAFKKRRKSLKGYEQRADARKRGHVGKEWYNSGRTYSPDEAKRMRANMDDEERSTRHRSSVDPEGDDSNYSADRTKNPKKQRKQAAMGEEFQSWVESLIEEGYDLSEYTWDEMYDIYEEEQLQELSNRKLRAYIKKSEKSHKEINKKWDQGTATEKEKLKSIGHEIGQERAFKRLNKEEFDEAILNELNRTEKQTGINTKTGKPTQTGGMKDDKAFTHVKRMIRGMEGKPAGQRKKVPGKKPPAAGQFGGPESPAQKVAKRRAAAARSQEMQSSKWD